MIEMFHVRVANVPAMLLNAVAELGGRDPRMTWDLLYEAMHAALMAQIVASAGPHWPMSPRPPPPPGMIRMPRTGVVT